MAKKQVDTSGWSEKEIERGYAVRRKNGYPIYIYLDGEIGIGAPRDSVQPDKVYDDEEKKKSFKFSSRFNREKREKEIIDTLNDILDENAQKFMEKEDLSFAKDTLSFGFTDAFSVNQANDTTFDFEVDKKEPLNVALWKITKSKGNDWIGYRNSEEISIEDFNKIISSLYKRRVKSGRY